MTKRKVAFDMVLNITAVAVPIMVLQFIVYPLVAKAIDAESYGLMITVYSVWSIVSNTIGNAFNNVRLLNNNTYKEKAIEGDFNILLLVWNAVNCIVVAVVLIIITDKIAILSLILDLFIAILFLAKAYLEVSFRIQLNYRNILICNIIQASGFVIGGWLTIKTGTWQWIFLFGYLQSVLFCCFKTTLLKEKRIKTELFSKISRECIALIAATVLASMMSYADKLVLYPLMGGFAVSIYYTATLLGKVVSMLTGPINSVILSYISRWDSTKKNVLNNVLAVGVFVVIVGYFITLFASEPVLRLLYPQWVNEVMKYVPVTTVTVMLAALNAFVCPFVLKFCDVRWQIAINTTGLLTYFVFALLLWNQFGLYGFCFGSILGELSRLFIMLIIYYKNSNKQIGKEENNAI